MIQLGMESCEWGIMITFFTYSRVKTDKSNHKSPFPTINYQLSYDVFLISNDIYSLLKAVCGVAAVDA